MLPVGRVVEDLLGSRSSADTFRVDDT